ncbi:MAG: DUF928 domain-containing protein [Cyanobacteria bacterium J06598_3]
MKSLWSLHCFLLLSGVLSFSLTSFAFTLASRASAETIKAEHPTAANPSFVLFEPPNGDTVNNSRGGASRPAEVKCAEDDAYGFPLTALIPQSGLGLTTRAHPTLMVYVPPTTARQVHFTLRDSNRQGLYQTQIPIAPTGGILNITLPADSPELLVGSRYQWSLGLLCQSPQTDMPIARGQIQRVDVPEDVAWVNQPLLAQATAYGQAGIWHDMLASLVVLQQRQADHSELSDGQLSDGQLSDGQLSHYWVQLLEAEQLGAIARSPLLNQTGVPSPK